MRTLVYVTGHFRCENVGLRLCEAQSEFCALAQKQRQRKSTEDVREPLVGALQAETPSPLPPRTPHPSPRLAGTRPSSGLFGSIATQTNSICYHGNHC